MFDARKFLANSRPFFMRIKKNSGFFSKKFLIELRKNKISRHKLKKLINALDDSKLTKKWVRGIMVSVLCVMIVGKVAENYDEDLDLRGNAKNFIKYLKKIKKRQMIND